MKRLKKIDLPFVAICLSFFGFMATYFDYVPMWDAWINASVWIHNAVSESFNIFNFENGHHPSEIYFLIISSLQYLDLGNQYLLHAASTVLAILGVIFFYKILGVLLTQKRYIFERFFLTALFAFYPLFTANVLHENPDYGVMVFFLALIYYLISDRLVPAMIAGILLLFTKEVSLALYPIAVGVHFLVKLPETKITFPRILAKIREYLIFLLPIIIFFIRTVIKVAVLHQPAFWLGLNPKSVLTSPFSSWVVSRLPYSYLLTVFVINFNWILTLFIFFGIMIFVCHLSKHIKSQHQVTYLSNQIYIMLIFPLTAIFLTLYKTFTNPRYFLSIYAMMIIVFSLSIIWVIPFKKPRRLLLVVIVGIFLVANFRTLDPISMAVYGTFQFGKHKMLKMTGITGECCGYGRDQIVYNLEYTQIHYILNQIFTDLKPDENTAIVFSDQEGPYVTARIDKTTYNRTMKSNNAIDLSKLDYKLVWSFDTLELLQRPSTLFFIDFPNVYSQLSLAYYLQYYDKLSEKTYERMGYSMKVYTLELKSV